MEQNENNKVNLIELLLKLEELESKINAELAKGGNN